MFASRMVRHLVGVLFCGAAGLSLTSMVLPSVIAATGLSDALWARFSLSGYAAHAVVLWAIGVGLLVGKLLEMPEDGGRGM
jgi:hypothetical protein